MIDVENNNKTVALKKLSKLNVAILVITAFYLGVCNIFIGNDDALKFFDANKVSLYIAYILFFSYCITSILIFISSIIIFNKYCIPPKNKFKAILLVFLFSFIGVPFLWVFGVNLLAHDES